MTAKDDAADGAPPLPPPGDGAVDAVDAAAITDSQAPSNQQQQQQSAQQPNVIITGLAILPPRQIKGDGVCGSKSVVRAALRLPPLRAEEPVAALRGALSEVVGYAHLTRYRLVVERTSAEVVVGEEEAAASKDAAAPSA